MRRTILALSRLLRELGPQLGRPHVDCPHVDCPHVDCPHVDCPHVDMPNGSRHANMKEMRFSAADGEWRVAFAFDPARRTILPAAGDKSGGGERRFYRALIAKADERFDRHLTRFAEEGGS